MAVLVAAVPAAVFENMYKLKRMNMKKSTIIILVVVAVVVTVVLSVVVLSLPSELDFTIKATTKANTISRPRTKKYQRFLGCSSSSYSSKDSS